jgi:hypothetical protein
MLNRPDDGGFKMHDSRTCVTILLWFFVWITAPALIATAASASTPIYTYIDEAGVQTFTNEFDSIPERYRGQVAPRESAALSEPQTAPAAAQPPTPTGHRRVVTGTAEHRMGDHDTRADAVRLAVEAAKADALEQVATYVERLTEVRDWQVTRDEIRSFTAGIVTVAEQHLTSRLEQDRVVIRVELTAEIDEREVVQAIAALRENESARHELVALQAETERLQRQLETATQALARASTAEEVQQFKREREDMFDELQANTLRAQAWSSWTYPTLGVYSVPFVAVPGMKGLHGRGPSLGHPHEPMSRHPAPPPGSAPSAQVPPLLNQQGLPAKVGDVVVIPAPRSVPPVASQSVPQAQPYQVHPNHFWRPTPPNIQSLPSSPQQNPPASMAPQFSGGNGKPGGGGFSRGSGGRRGR